MEIWNSKVTLLSMNTRTALAALLILTLIVCAPAPSRAVGFPCYGEETETAARVELINMTGCVILALRICPETDAATADWTDRPNLLGADTFEKDARIGVFFELNEALSGPSSAKSISYAMRIALDDGRTLTLHHLDIADIGEAFLHLDEGVAYLVYTSAATGKEISTLPHELRLLAEMEMDGASLPESDGGRENPAPGDSDS